MAILKLFSEIVDKDTKVIYNWNGFEATCSDDVVNFINNIPQDDPDITIRINCVGGFVTEGWRMYDALRQSGKNISAIVEGVCASMATIILMAAPKERRHSYQNATFLIHDPAAMYPSVGAYPDRLTADELERMAETMKIQAGSLRDEEEKILNLYVERTGTDIEVLRSLMKEDKTITTAKAIEIGLIADTLAPNTANIKMNNNAKVEVGQNWLNRLLAKAGFKSVESVKFTDLTFTAADGTSFVVEREEGMYAKNDAASPDGNFVMEDGSTVVINGGFITDIIPAKMELTNPENGNVIGEDEAQQLLNAYFAQVNDLKQQIADLNAQTDSLNASLSDLTAKFDAANETIEHLNGLQITDEQRSMLDTIETAGGKVWFDAIIAKQSDGAPKNDPNFTPSANLGESFLAMEKKNSRRFVK